MRDGAPPNARDASTDATAGASGGKPKPPDGSSGTDGGTAGSSAHVDAGPPSPAETFCAEFATAQCAFHRRCNQPCRASEEDEHYLEQCMAGVLAVRDARADFDAAEASACAAGFADLSCDAADSLVFDATGRCANVFSGALPADAPCYAGSGFARECRDGLLCKREGGSCPGRCVAAGPGETCVEGRCAGDAQCDGNTCRAPVAEGDDCSGFPVCEAGRLCRTGTCVAPAEDGQACDAHEDCRIDRVCVERRCQLEVEIGDACVSSINCPGAHCDPTHVCAADTGRDGDPCSLGCIAPLECLEDQDGVSRCRPRPSEAQACSAQRPCASELFCVAGRCAASGGAGSACTGMPSSCRSGLWCNPQSSRCEEPGGTGAACDLDQRTACAAGLFCRCDQAPDSCRSGAASAHCRAQVTDGANCEGNGDGFLLRSASCTTGVCRRQCDFIHDQCAYACVAPSTLPAPQRCVGPGITGQP